MKRIVGTISLAAVGLLLISGGPGAAQQAGWEQQATAEARGKLGCEVSYISHVVERQVQGETVVMAKIHCEDKRSFDAVRDKASDPFTFKECTPREQTSC